MKTQPLTFKQLVRLAFEKEDLWANYWKTATQTGWLTNHEFLTKLTNEEVRSLKELKMKSPGGVEAGNPTKAIPKTCGGMANEEKEVDGKIYLTNSTGNVSVCVKADLYLSLRRRHPNAMAYFGNNPQTDAIVFSEKSDIVALLVPTSK